MTTTAGKRADLVAQKAKRQKQFVIGGSVLLIALLVFQVPRVMKHLNSSTNVPATSLSSGATPTPTVPGSTVPGTTLPLPAVPSTLRDTDRVTVTPDSGQLVSFGLFKSKDPFVQQLSDTTPVDTTETPTATTPVETPTVTQKTPVSPPTSTVPSGVSFPTTSTTTTPAPVVTPPPTTTPSTPPPAPQPTTPPGSVALKIGGACQVVPLGGTFPKGTDIFRIESIGKDGSIKISVNGGTYESGAATVTLKKGSTLTLLNTADGARYILKLVSACPSGPGASTPTTSAPTTPTSTTPTSTLTTTSPTTPTTTQPKP